MPEDWTDPFEDWFLEDPLGRLMHKPARLVHKYRRFVPTVKDCLTVPAR